MKILRKTLFLVGFAASACLFGECSPNTLTVLVNKANPTESLSMPQLRKLMLGDVHSWPDKKPVLVVRRDAASPAFHCLLSAVVRMTESEFKRYLMNTEFRGEEAVPQRTAATADAAVKMVISVPGSIAIVEGAAVQSNPALKVVRINGKMPGEPGYPL